MTKKEYLINEIIDCCEEVMSKGVDERTKELAEIVAYDHIKRIMKGDRDDSN